MKVVEITFREWVMCKLDRICTAPPPAAPERKRNPAPTRLFKLRSGEERRAEQPDAKVRGKEWRRAPERRLPEVRDSTVEEFNRWKK